MKTLKNFLNDLVTDNQLRAHFEKIDSMIGLCKEAQKYGYDFTEAELTECYLDAVSGGAGIDNSSHTGSLEQRVEGTNNVQINYGNITVSDGIVPKQPGESLSKQEKLQIMNWVLSQKK